MSLTPGTTLGSYEVVGLVGAGGMGEVWRARDKRLGREVAIKALPPVFARDPERLARFEREARILASLSHPNVAGIHGLEDIDGTRYLILEFVDGETLAGRIARGPISIREALEIGLQIATALEVAHESGIIHRDLKPANVKLTPAGTVKVLDFGLAKGTAAAGESSSGMALSQSPTITLAMTGEGLILGTAAYMSPEQARGKAVDRRTDIWAFGCVLYECLTGRQLFEGETVSDLIARILEREPDWNTLPEGTPARLRDLLKRCLDKDAKHRLRDIGDARLEIEGILADFTSSFRPAKVAPRRMARLLPALTWAGVAGLAVTAGFLLARGGSGSRPAERVVRFSFRQPPATTGFADPNDLAVSPDGRLLAFVAVDSTGTGALWLRSLDSMAPRVVAGTENATLPFWSPDGRHVAFFADGKLKRIPLDGGRAEVLCDANNGRGGSWGRRGDIVFAPAGEGPVFRVSERGGEVTQVTALDTARHESAHRFPRFLPDGEHFLYASVPPKQGKHDIFLASVKGGAPKLLLTAESAPVYADPGYLLFLRGETIAAQRFDADRHKLSGEPIPLPDAPAPSFTVSSPAFAVSPSGVLAYLSGGRPNTQLVWLDRAGNRIGRVPTAPGRDEFHAISPDGSRLASVRSPNASETDIWILEMARGTLSRFTYGGAFFSNPIWSPDGRRLIYESNRSGRWDLYMRAIAGSGEEEPIYQSQSFFKHPADWSSDGRHVVFEQLDEKTGWDVWRLDMETREAKPFLRSPFNERFGSFSGDGRWLTYFSDESGRGEIYVQSFPDASEKHQISTNGGIFPLFRQDGTEIVFLGGDFVSVQSVAVETAPMFRPAVPRTLFRLPTGVAAFDVTPDFQRFLLSIPEDENQTGELHVVLGWPAELARK